MGVVNRTVSTVLVVVTRALFILHGLLTIWFLTTVRGDFYYAFLFFLALFSIEIYWVLGPRKSKEWTWFSIPVLLYLCCVVPCIWLLRVNQIENFQTSLNCTTQSGLTNDDCNVELPKIFGAVVPIKLDPNTWIEVLDQSLVFILIITRWLAPRGHISQRKLSEMLLIYVGLGSDIVELFVLFEDEYVLTNLRIVYWILVVWSVSLIQFMLPLTGAMRPSSRRALDQTPGWCRDCMRSEAWTILAIVMLQDGPFLAIRLYIMIVGNVITYSLVFFTCKNILVVALQCYRLCVLLCCVDGRTGKTIRIRRPSSRAKEPARGTKPSLTPAPQPQRTDQGNTNDALDSDSESDSSVSEAVNDPV